MHLNSAQIQQASIIWVLVADGEGAKIYRYHDIKKLMPMHDSKREPYEQEMKRHELTPVIDMEFKAQSLQDFQGARDELGYSQSRGERYSSVDDEIAQHLVTQVVSKLNNYCKSKAFDNLVIVAPLKILGAFKQQLNPHTLNRVIAEIDRDFAGDKSHASLAHLQKTIAGVHIA